MGYDINRFINCNEINADFICNICKGVLEEAVWSPNCEHAFCSVCINAWLNRRDICPNDRQPLNSSLLKPIPRFMRNILDKMDIKCEFVANGCLEVVPLESIRQHVRTCEFNPEKRVDCVSGCGLVIKKADLESHNCVKELRKKVDFLIEDNLKSNQLVASFRHDLNGLRHENRRINDLVFNLQNEVKRLSSDRKTSVINDSTPRTRSSLPLLSATTSISQKSSDRNSRVVPNPYVLITPLQPSTSLERSDESSSSRLIPSTSSRLVNEEPVFKRMTTTIRVATPVSTVSSPLMHSYSSTRDESYMSGTSSTRFMPNMTALSPSNEFIPQDEESTSAITITDNSYNYITLDADQDFDDNEETELEDDSIQQINDYEIEVQANDE